MTLEHSRQMPQVEPAGLGDLLAGIADLLGTTGLVTDPALLGRHRCDWSGKNPQMPIAVARPRSTQELSSILRMCHARSQPVVVQGGLTGLVGGATPRPGELAISLERMSAIEQLDPQSAVMIVGAGATLQAAQQAASAAGLNVALDLPSRGSCTIGGNIATNAGGHRVLRYGTMRSQVLGIEAVLADGTVLSSLGCVLKDNAGYDLKQLFIGTEGTLGIVARASLRLYPEPVERMTAMLATASFARGIATLAALQRRLGPALTAFEAMWDDYFESVLDFFGHPRPFGRRHAFYAIVEIELRDPATDRAGAEAALEALLSDQLIEDAILASSQADAGRLWQIREAAGEMHARRAPSMAYDISMSIGEMDDYIARVKSGYASYWPEGLCCAFGHLGDGNLHVLATLRNAGDAEAVDAIVYGALAPGRSISGEHGVGVGKRGWLGVSRSAAEIGVMRDLKRLLDPRGILNPGRVI